MHKKQI